VPGPAGARREITALRQAPEFATLLRGKVWCGLGVVAGSAPGNFHLANTLNFNENVPGKLAFTRDTEPRMSISTEDRTQPKLGPYYAIMAGAFAASVGALILLNWTAFALVAVASTIIVIIAAARLGIAGSQIVVDDDAAITQPPVTWKQALISLAIFAGFGAVIAASAVFDRRLPEPWQDLIRFAYFYLMFGYLTGSLLREFRRSWATRSEHRPIPLAIRFSILIVGAVILAGALYFLTVQNDRLDFADIPLGLLIVIALLSFGASGTYGLFQRRGRKPAPPPKP